MNGSFWVILLGSPGILGATTVHEFVRALTSTVLGDTYPKSQGQVTLNPVKHFEPIGFLMMLYSGGFGWGKPVETSALYLVAILPTVVNLILGLVFLLAYGTFRSKGYYIGTLLHYLAYYNVALAVYNVLPVAPMDCTKVLAVLLPANQYFKYMQNEKLIQMLFLFLLFFGMITGFMDKIIYAVLSLFGGMIGLM